MNTLEHRLIILTERIRQSGNEELADAASALACRCAFDKIRDRFGWEAATYASVVLGESRSVPDAFRELAEGSTAKHFVVMPSECNWVERPV